MPPLLATLAGPGPLAVAAYRASGRPPAHRDPDAARFTSAAPPRLPLPPLFLTSCVPAAAPSPSTIAAALALLLLARRSSPVRFSGGSPRRSLGFGRRRTPEGTAAAGALRSVEAEDEGGGGLCMGDAGAGASGLPRRARLRYLSKGSSR